MKNLTLIAALAAAATLSTLNLNAAEAAAILRTSPKAIDNRLYRARNLLRERLKSWV